MRSRGATQGSRRTGRPPDHPAPPPLHRPPVGALGRRPGARAPRRRRAHGPARRRALGRRSGRCGCRGCAFSAPRSTRASRARPRSSARAPSCSARSPTACCRGRAGRRCPPSSRSSPTPSTSPAGPRSSRHSLARHQPGVRRALLRDRQPARDHAGRRAAGGRGRAPRRHGRTARPHGLRHRVRGGRRGDRRRPARGRRGRGGHPRRGRGGRGGRPAPRGRPPARGGAARGVPAPRARRARGARRGDRWRRPPHAVGPRRRGPWRDPRRAGASRPALSLAGLAAPAGRWPRRSRSRRSGRRSGGAARFWRRCAPCRGRAPRSWAGVAATVVGALANDSGPTMLALGTAALALALLYAHARPAEPAEDGRPASRDVTLRPPGGARRRSRRRARRPGARRAPPGALSGQRGRTSRTAISGMGVIRP